MMRTGKTLDVDDMIYINKALVEAGFRDGSCDEKMLQRTYHSRRQKQDEQILSVMSLGTVS